MYEPGQLQIPPNPKNNKKQHPINTNPHLPKARPGNKRNRFPFHTREVGAAKVRKYKFHPPPSPAGAGEGGRGGEGISSTSGEGSSELITTVETIQFNGKVISNNGTIEQKQVSGTNGIQTETLVKFPIAGDLSDGAHNIVVVAKDKYGHISQGAWQFYVDTIAPSLDIKPLPDISERRIEMRYVITDPETKFLTANIQVNVLPKNRGYGKAGTESVVTENVFIRQAIGDNFFTYKPEAEHAEGLYTVELSAADEAGNKSVTTSTFTVDKSAPLFLDNKLEVLPELVNSETEKIEASAYFYGEILEKVTGNVQILNSEGAVIGYQPFDEIVDTGQKRWLDGYNWPLYKIKASIPNNQNLRDGTNTLRVVLIDSAGNAGVVSRNMSVDKTAPDALDLFVDKLSLEESSGFQAKIHFTSEEDLKVNIKAKALDTGKEYQIAEYGNLTAGEHEMPFSGSGFENGQHSIEITLTDKSGNTKVFVREVIKGGAVPVITSPLPYDEFENFSPVGGQIIIQGRVQDPDWTNAELFDRYELYYREGEHSSVDLNTLNLSVWQSDEIRVPSSREGAKPNQSVYEVKINSALGYLDTAKLVDNKLYTILVLVYEKGKVLASASALTTIKIDKMVGELHVPPVVSFENEIPAKIDFNTAENLPIDFAVANRLAHVNLTILNQAGDAVYARRYQDVSGPRYWGKPNITEYSKPQIYVWQDKTGWHLRAGGGEAHDYEITLVGVSSVGKTYGLAASSIKSQAAGIVQARFSTDWHLVGFDFVSDEAFESISLMPYLDKDKVDFSQSFFSGMNAVRFGVDKIGVGAGVSLTLKKDNNNIRSDTGWNGKLATGEYAANGKYQIVLEAEGVNGIGLTRAAKTVEVMAPLELRNIELISAPEFSLVRGNDYPNQVDFGFNLTQKARVTAWIESAEKKIMLKENALYEGNLSGSRPHVISWQGNYPVASPNVFVDIAKDNEYEFFIKLAESDQAFNVPGIKIVRYEAAGVGNDFEVAGEKVDFRGAEITLAKGAVMYKWRIPISGKYYQPMTAEYKLAIKSAYQAVPIYPYVPFAAVAHRSFEQIDVKLKLDYAFEYEYRQGGDYREDEKDYVEFGGIISLTNKTPRYKALNNELHKEWERGKRGFNTRLGWKRVRKCVIEVWDREKEFILDKFVLNDENDIIPDINSTSINNMRYKIINSQNNTVYQADLADKAAMSNSAHELTYEGMQTVTYNLVAGDAVYEYENWKPLHPYKLVPDWQDLGNIEYKETIEPGYILSEKGLFKAKVMFCRYGMDVNQTVKNGPMDIIIGERPLVDDNILHLVLRVQDFGLSDNFNTSRLNNRFYAWYGWVNALEDANISDYHVKDFQKEFDKLNTLGFPGGSFFDSDFSLTAVNPNEEIIKDAGNDPEAWLEKYLDQLVAVQNKNHPDTIVDESYYNYLAKNTEKFRFYKITKPHEGKIATVNGLIMKAETSYKLDSSKDTVLIPWPLTEAEVAVRNQANKNQFLENGYATSEAKKYRKDITNIDFTPDELGFYWLDQVLDSNAYSMERMETIPIQYKGDTKIGYVSQKTVGQIMFGNSNQLQSVEIELTKNSGPDNITFEYTKPENEADSLIQARVADWGSAWSIKDDPNNPKGNYLESNWQEYVPGDFGKEQEIQLKDFHYTWPLETPYNQVTHYNTMFLNTTEEKAIVLNKNIVFSLP
ncbi:Ig-like domain repeat protein, partial [Candidatus Margulisiibacteriota bacterium]